MIAEAKHDFCAIRGVEAILYYSAQLCLAAKRRITEKRILP
jgi:hypothetical protein